MLKSLALESMEQTKSTPTSAQRLSLEMLGVMLLSREEQTSDIYHGGRCLQNNCFGQRLTEFGIMDGCQILLPSWHLDHGGTPGVPCRKRLIRDQIFSL